MRWPGFLNRIFERERRSVNGAGHVPAAPVLSGTYVTPQTALSLAAVYSAINIISRDLAVLPKAVYRKLPDGGREIDPTKRVHGLISVAPNDDMDAFRYFQCKMGHTLGWGNGLSQIVRDRRSGEPVELLPLHPGKTKILRREKTGQLYYKLVDDRELAPENVLHFAGLSFNGITGYSPIGVCRQTIGLALAAEQTGAALFGNGMIKRGILKLMRKLSPQAVSNLRASLNQVHQGSQGSHQFLILEEGMDWVDTQINPDDGQWLGTREFQVKDIARIYSIPPHKIGDYSESHLANVEEANSDYVTTTLFGWVVMMEAQMNLKLLTTADRLQWEIGIDMEAFLRGNTTARMAKYQTLRNAGAINADEIRLGEGMNPLKKGSGGNLYLVQGQYVPLYQVGVKPDPPPAPVPVPVSVKEPEPSVDKQS